MTAADAIKKFGLEQVISYIFKEPEENLRKVMDWADAFAAGSYEGPRRVIREVIEDPDHPYHPFVIDLLENKTELAPTG